MFALLQTVVYGMISSMAGLGEYSMRRLLNAAGSERPADSKLL